MPSRTSLTNPSFANIVRKTSEYETRPTAHGRKIAVRQKPFALRRGLFSRLARTRASTIMIGTWTIR